MRRTPGPRLGFAPRQGPRRRAFTLLELLLAAGFTAMACTAAMLMIRSINNSSSAGAGMGQAATAARNAIAVMDMLVEQANLIGYRDDNQILIWRGDDNQDSQINLLELTLFRYDSQTASLNQLEIRFPAGTPSYIINQANVALTTGQFCSVTAANQVRQHAKVWTRRLADGLGSFLAWSDGVNSPGRTAVVTFRMDRADGSQAFHAVLAPRSPVWSLLP